MARMRASVRRRREGKKKASAAPVRLPGLNFDTFEDENARYEGAYSTDRAPTYQSRYAAEHPRRYVRRFLNWLRGGSKRRKTRQIPMRRRQARRSGPVRRPMH